MMRFVFLVSLLACLLPGPSSSVPMVENSVRFALERCRQFLHLATYLRDGALSEDRDGIGRTKKICDHIVMLESDFKEEEKEEEEEKARVAETQGLKKNKKDKKKRNKNKKKDDTSTADETEEEKEGEEEEEIGSIQMKSPRKDDEEGSNSVPSSLDIDADGEDEDEDGAPSFSCMVQLYLKQNFQGDPITLRKSVNDTHSMAIKSLRVVGPCTWRFFNSSGFRGEFFVVSGENSALEERERASPSSWGWKVGQMRSVKRMKNKKNRRKKAAEGRKKRRRKRFADL